MTQTAAALDFPHHDRILILDFGSQVTQLIARRVRESGVYCEIWPFNHAPEEKIKAFAPRGIILSGGPASVAEEDSPRAPQIVFDLGVPVFGICYGQQTMVAQLGGRVEGSGLSDSGGASSAAPMSMLKMIAPSPKGCGTPARMNRSG